MKCNECSNAMAKGELELRRTVAGRDFSTVVEGWSCSVCGNRVYRAPDAIAFEESIAQELAANGPVTGESFAAMRAALRLRSADVAGLLGVANETISRWENSKRRMDRSAWFILSTLVLDWADGSRATIERLENLRGKAASA
jgi:putative zinc finger/helix-turn-helix YgiT family protein